MFFILLHHQQYKEKHKQLPPCFPPGLGSKNEVNSGKRRHDLSTYLPLPDRPPRAARPVLLFRPPPSPNNLPFYLSASTGTPLICSQLLLHACSMNALRPRILAQDSGFEPASLLLPCSTIWPFGLPLPIFSPLGPLPSTPRFDQPPVPPYLYGPVSACYRRGVCCIAARCHPTKVPSGRPTAPGGPHPPRHRWRVWGGGGAVALRLAGGVASELPALYRPRAVRAGSRSCSMVRDGNPGLSSPGSVRVARARAVAIALSAMRSA